jgi:hypothetical protein
MLLGNDYLARINGHLAYERSVLARYTALVNHTTRVGVGVRDWVRRDRVLLLCPGKERTLLCEEPCCLWPPRHSSR